MTFFYPFELWRKAISKTNLGQRLIEIGGDENRGEYCARLGINDRTYRDYESGKSLPNTDVLTLISNEQGISLNWLVLGEGPIRPGDPEAPQAAAIETEFFVAVQETIRKTYREVGARINDADLARFSAETYAQYIALAVDPNDEAVRTALMVVLKDNLKKQLTTATPDQAQSKRLA